ncbi:unnamed protein product [Symbiodinium necroappetens]|uniref:Uncharacterized protein n=1 Tax=Symbiodinium necroappetens TaxID=1628268 RepID=A0A813CG13_9DINO|nr:unnamed protein product [Symbiodinium necroappetens]
MRDTEYVLQCYINRESDMTDTIPAETLKIMTEAYKLGPTCSEMMAATFAFMSLDLFTQDRSEPARLAKDVTAFLKFASTHLLLTRKDQPAKAVALLEKMQKDLKLASHALPANSGKRPSAGGKPGKK